MSGVFCLSTKCFGCGNEGGGGAVRVLHISCCISMYVYVCIVIETRPVKVSQFRWFGRSRGERLPDMAGVRFGRSG